MDKVDSPEVVMLKLDDVTVSYNLNPRVGTRSVKVKEYAEVIDHLPPMVVFDVPERGLLLAAGFHRYFAHIEAGRAEGKFIIKEGTYEEAQTFADIDNLTHGLPLSRKEKRQIYARMIKRYPFWSNVGLARACFTTDKTISAIRAELENKGVVERFEKLLGVDGRWRLSEVDRGQKPASPPRRQTTLAERQTSCQVCQWPISQRHHLLEHERFGESEWTVQFCPSCHDLYHVIYRSIDDLAGDNLQSRNLALLQTVKKKWGVLHETFAELRRFVTQVRDTKLALINGQSNDILARYLDYDPDGDLS